MKVSYLVHEAVPQLAELAQRMEYVAALGYHGIELTATHPLGYSIEDGSKPSRHLPRGIIRESCPIDRRWRVGLNITNEVGQPCLHVCAICSVLVAELHNCRRPTLPEYFSRWALVVKDCQRGSPRERIRVNL